jgi:hypothetical protein
MIRGAALPTAKDRRVSEKERMIGEMVSLAPGSGMLGAPSGGVGLGLADVDPDHLPATGLVNRVGDH